MRGKGGGGEGRGRGGGGRGKGGGGGREEGSGREGKRGEGRDSLNFAYSFFNPGGATAISYICRRLINCMSCIYIYTMYLYLDSTFKLNCN